ncbi:hypothetical protein Nazgul07 [Burkholderia phage BcepNazgul]|uniref:Uncharacterized protein n=1 Tax=Burkholderia phage BcepNazgul TaxID=242861 RepID=Q2HPF7_9CAUD|nr:hypothetical protein Nazgul07 [Burkholderia phage BcepNazgul]ABD46770.1 hypothetical protein Nazgul07 [Burkholderia phage BcepNazgul]
MLAFLFSFRRRLANIRACRHLDSVLLARRLNVACDAALAAVESIRNAH